MSNQIIHTLESYLNNPSQQIGDHSQHNKIIVGKYESELSKLIASKEYHFNPRALFKDSSTIYIHIQIPSTSINNFYYDTVIEFGLDPNENGVLLNNAKIRFYTNAPSFIYSYAHAYLKRGLICEKFKDKFPPEIRQYSEVRNPKLNITYEKIITQALLYIKHNGLLNTAVLKKHETKESFPSFKANIPSFDEKMSERKAKEQIQKSEEAKRKKTIEKGLKKMEESGKSTAKVGKKKVVDLDKLVGNRKVKTTVSFRTKNRVKDPNVDLSIKS